MDALGTIKKRDTAEIRLKGDINFYVSPDIWAILLTACRSDIRQVVVDFSAVTSMDTSGVAILIQGLRWGQKEGKSFVLKNVGQNVRNTLALTKLEEAFHILPDSRAFDRNYELMA